MTQDLMIQAGFFGCFVFGTPSAQIGYDVPFPVGPCGFAYGSPGDGKGGLYIQVDAELPFQAGVYRADNFFGRFDTPTGIESIYGRFDYPSSDGTITLTITDVFIPEPASFSLTALGLAALAGAFIKLKLARG